MCSLVACGCRIKKWDMPPYVLNTHILPTILTATMRHCTEQMNLMPPCEYDLLNRSAEQFCKIMWLRTETSVNKKFAKVHRLGQIPISNQEHCPNPQMSKVSMEWVHGQYYRSSIRMQHPNPNRPLKQRFDFADKKDVFWTTDQSLPLMIMTKKKAQCLWNSYGWCSQSISCALLPFQWSLLLCHAEVWLIAHGCS